MNTDKSSSQYTRIKGARAIAAYDADRYTAIRSGLNQAFRGSNTNIAGSRITDVRIGIVDGDPKFFAAANSSAS